MTSKLRKSEKKGSAMKEYEKQEILGQGGCGYIVRAVSRRTGVERAVKVVRKVDSKRPLTVEAYIQRAVDHPHIVRVYETFECEKKLYLVMEHCQGGSLADKLTRYWHSMSEVHVAVVMRQIFCALRHMHCNKVGHRDLVPGNVLFANVASPLQSIVKVADFGDACRTTDFHEDLEACGRLLMVLLGKVTITTVDNKRATVANPNGVQITVSRDAKSLLSHLMNTRQDPFSVGKALVHPWMKKNAPRSRDVKIPRNFIDKLTEYKAHSPLKKLVLQVVADQLGGEHCQNKIDSRSLFLRMNTNCDGYLTPSEVMRSLRKTKDPRLKKLMQSVDGDAIGVLDYTTFLAIMLDESSYTQRDVCWDAFCTFDRDGDGSISHEELAEVLWGRDAQGSLIHGPVDEFLQGADADQNGTLSFDEFFSMMNDHAPTTPKLRRSEKKAKAAGVCSSDRGIIRSAKIRALAMTVRQDRREKKLKKKLEAKIKLADLASGGTGLAVADGTDVANLDDLTEFLCDLCSDSEETADEMMGDDVAEDSDGFRELLEEDLRPESGICHGYNDVQSEVEICSACINDERELEAVTPLPQCYTPIARANGIVSL